MERIKLAVAILLLIGFSTHLHANDENIRTLERRYQTTRSDEDAQTLASAFKRTGRNSLLFDLIINHITYHVSNLSDLETRLQALDRFRFFLENYGLTISHNPTRDSGLNLHSSTNLKTIAALVITDPEMKREFSLRLKRQDPEIFIWLGIAPLDRAIESLREWPFYYSETKVFISDETTKEILDNVSTFSIDANHGFYFALHFAPYTPHSGTPYMRHYDFYKLIPKIESNLFLTQGISEEEHHRITSEFAQAMTQGPLSNFHSAISQASRILELKPKSIWNGKGILSEDPNESHPVLFRLFEVLKRLKFRFDDQEMAWVFPSKKEITRHDKLSAAEELAQSVPNTSSRMRRLHLRLQKLRSDCAGKLGYFEEY